MRRLLTTLSILTVFSLTLASCGWAREAGEAEPGETVAEVTAVADQPTEAPVETPTTEPSQTPTSESEGEDEATAGTATPTETPSGENRPSANAEGIVKVASQSALTGPLSDLGTAIRNAAELGFTDNAEPLSELGYDVEFVPFDDQGTPETGAANAEEIASDEQVLCVVNGHLNSDVALEAAPVYADAGLAVVVAASTSPSLTEEFDNVFRMVGRADVEAQAGAQFASEELGAQSVFIVHDPTAYGQEIANLFRQNVEGAGIEVAGFESIPEGDDKDFQPLVDSIASAEPDVVYYAGWYDQAGDFLSAAADGEFQTIYMGQSGLDSPTLVDTASNAIGGMFYTTVGAPISQFPKAQGFAGDYSEEYQTDPPPFAAQTYDAMALCLNAIQTASEEAGSIPSREQVLTALASLETYEGNAGDYTFTENGELQQATYYVMEGNADGWVDNALLSRQQRDPSGAEVQTAAEPTPEGGTDEGAATPEGEEGGSEAAPEATPEGEEGEGEAAPEATPEGEGEAAPEATPEGEEGEGETTPEATPEGEEGEGGGS